MTDHSFYVDRFLSPVHDCRKELETQRCKLTEAEAESRQLLGRLKQMLEKQKSIQEVTQRLKTSQEAIEEELKFLSNEVKERSKQYWDLLPEVDIRQKHVDVEILKLKTQEKELASRWEDRKRSHKMALECLDKLLPLSNLTPSNAAPPVDSERGTPAGKDCGGVDQRPNSVESKQEASTVAALVDDVRSDGDRASQTISSRVNIDGNRGMGAKDTRDDMNGHEEDVIMKAGIHVASSPSVAPAIPTPAPASTEPNLHSCQGDDAKANLSADSDVVINTASYNDAFTLLEDLVGCIEENFPEAVNTDIGSDASLIASNRGLDLRDGAEDLQRVRDELMQNWDDLTGLADSCSYIGDSLIPSLQTNKMCLPCFQDLVWAGENEASLEISGDVKQNLTEHSVDQEPDKGAGGENDEAQDNTNRD